MRQRLEARAARPHTPPFRRPPRRPPPPVFPLPEIWVLGELEGAHFRGGYQQRPRDYGRSDLFFVEGFWQLQISLNYNFSIEKTISNFLPHNLKSIFYLFFVFFCTVCLKCASAECSSV